ncbi:hypothetical protein ILUMI_26180, partial [Ignelater luminosus]
NTSLTWETNDPTFTTCFEKSVLVWIPCIFLWVFASFEVSYIINSKHKDIPWNFLNIPKLFITCVLITLSITDVVTAIVQGEVYNVDIYSPIVKALTFALSAILLVSNRKYGLRTSGVQFIFWLLVVLCAIPQFRTEILEAQKEKPEPYYFFISYMIYFPLAVIMLFLNCFADKAPKVSGYPKSDKTCPEEKASFLSRIFYQWFDSLLWRGFKKPLEASDLWNIRNEDTSREIVPRFDQHWNKAVEEAEKNTPQYPRAEFKSNSGRIDFVNDGDVKKIEVSVLPALIRAFGPAFLFGCLLKLIHTILIFVSPQILSLLITFTEQQDVPWKGYLYVACLFITSILQTLVSSQYTQKMSVIGMNVRTALIAAIYKKSLRLSNSAKKEGTMGEMINLMAVDAQTFNELMPYINIIWSSPLEIALALYFLWQILGPSALTGLAVMIILIPVNGAIVKRLSVVQFKQLAKKDERVKIINEVLNGIKVLKLYAWEPSFEAQISKIRNKEIQLLKQGALVNAGMSFIFAFTPYLVTLMTFVVFVQSSEKNILTPQIAFVSLALFATLQSIMGLLPPIVVWIAESRVSLQRVNKFMNLDELDSDNVQHESNNNPIVIDKGNFSWGEDLILKNITTEFEKGSLTAVVGSVGSGKSSLIAAILGEMDKTFGIVNTVGSVAYVAQQAWIQNATIKDNITFGRDFEKSKYKKIVEACALKPDFDMLSAGDQTEIGEKGINVSGGQKQRISLARAVYTDADIYLLDDPLSAVDSHVGKHIFEKVIGPQGILKHTTRIFVTHSVTYLPMVDKIIVLKDGEISEAGTYQQLMDKKGAFSEFLQQYLNEANEKEDEESNNQLARKNSDVSETGTDKANGSLPRKKSIAGDENKENEPEEKLIEAEKTETGSVKWKVYKYYFETIGIAVGLAVILLYIVAQAFNIGSNIWLSTWTTDKNVTSEKRDLYLGVYGALGLAQVLFSFFGVLALFYGGLNGALLLHNLLLKNILKAPLNTFFDVTPIGRILNRFSQDIDTIDGSLPLLLRGFSNCFFGLLNTLFVISYTTPLFIAVILPIGVLYYLVQRYYVPTSRQLRRIEAVSRGPIYSHFSETIAGASAIRAFGVTHRFIKESESKVDSNQMCNYPSIIATRWLAVRLEMIGNLVILFASLFAVLGKDQDPGLVGLSIAYALQVTISLNLLVQFSSDIETNIVSVERIKEYGEISHEAPWELPNKAPPLTWPDNGVVVFKDYGLRYRPGLDLVLKNINVSIKSGEKVGIVGRTGAGKSTLTLSLFRIIEAAQGEILIDGVNIAGIGLHALRSRLTIIPQDSVLFSGSLRMNLDPFEKYSDEEIWRALEQANLKDFVKGLTAGLNHEITEGGENLSVGQRQLVCLSRALLRKTKVLILDEATAAVDLETDDLVQKTIRTEFKNCTILTIAHRLNTIIDSDKIIVLDKGCIAEFDSPGNLLLNKKSVFYSMARDAGLM